MFNFCSEFWVDIKFKQINYIPTKSLPFPHPEFALILFVSKLFCPLKQSMLSQQKTVRINYEVTVLLVMIQVIYCTNTRYIQIFCLVGRDIVFDSSRPTRQNICIYTRKLYNKVNLINKKTKL